MTKTNIQIQTNLKSGYTLLDSGNGRKLEQVGDVMLDRAEPRAWWKPKLAAEEWGKAHTISGKEEFEIEIASLKARIKLSQTTKHIGIFPEQSSQWCSVAETIEKAGRPIKVLNLFGYTGLASLAAAKAGAEVTHVDGSRVAIGWAKENQVLSGLADKPIRWILDDAKDFLKREVKRGVKYDAVIMDPPSYGKGPKGQVWKIEEQLPELLKLGREVLSETPLFFILNMYSTELSSISLANLLQDVTQDLGGTIEANELALRHEKSERLLPMSISAVWSA